METLLNFEPYSGQAKVKINGSHLVATANYSRKPVVRHTDELREPFESAYDIAYYSEELRDDKLVTRINELMNDFILPRCEDLCELIERGKEDYTNYIKEKLRQKVIAHIMRKRRFTEKADLHVWNYFVTLTYDSKRFASEDDFRATLLTCLSHLSCDDGWRYMGVFERGEVNERLHFHGIFYIPVGRMKGFLRESKYFSLKDKRMCKSNINSFFEVRFGRNDFQSIGNECNLTGIKNYILKYISKSDDRIIYARGIDSVIDMQIYDSDICAAYKLLHVTKYVLFDDIMKGTILDPTAQPEYIN